MYGVFEALAEPVAPDALPVAPEDRPVQLEHQVGQADVQPGVGNPHYPRAHEPPRGLRRGKNKTAAPGQSKPGKTASPTYCRCGRPCGLARDDAQLSQSHCG